MKKILKIAFNEKNIVINQDGREKLIIQKNPAKISGEQLYNCFFSDLKENEEISFEITSDCDLSRDDKIIFNRFKELIEDICEAINSSSTKTEETANVSSNAQL